VYYGIGSGRVLHSAEDRGMNCAGCQKDEEEETLYKCPICFKLACDNCANRAYGRVFCSKRCADQFFFGDDDD
jgi:hypothetical protein